MTDATQKQPPHPAATGFGLLYLALGLVIAGILTLTSRDFAQQWQPIPAWVPGRAALWTVSGLVLLGCGGAVLLKRAAPAVSRVLFTYLLLWFVLLKVPPVLRAPLTEVTWESLSEVAVLVAAGWVLYAELGGDLGSWHRVVPTGERGVRLARRLFGAALLPMGLSHFFYLKETISLIPPWMPGHAGWAYFCGAAHIAAGVGVLVGVLPRLATALEALMITSFTLLVWVPALVAAPADQGRWAEAMISWIIGAGAWVVADSYRGTRWMSRGMRKPGTSAITPAG